ncbi:maleylpyruvate isomerase N-terminal domain-containing protein [Ornithinimicrobium sp. W1665]|uniref:maleylpyruvate isomerase N-terminal domain-containing protein n=1 Tax=Ornithinimicrobium sp. W1665 TaxID=3416666 RepID=UPI003D6C20B4
MPVHPAPPVDVSGLVEAYRQTLSSFCDVADSLREQEWDLPTACPGWTARDHLAHVVHVEDYLSGSEHPGAGWSGVGDDPVRVGEPEHVRNSLGAWVEEGVRARRDQDPRGRWSPSCAGSSTCGPRACTTPTWSWTPPSGRCADARPPSRT